jgi:hypothetical protein
VRKNIAHQVGSATYKKESMGGISQNDSYAGRFTGKGKASASKSGANIFDKSVFGKAGFECYYCKRLFVEKSVSISTVL